MFAYSKSFVFPCVAADVLFEIWQGGGERDVVEGLVCASFAAGTPWPESAPQRLQRGGSVQRQHDHVTELTRTGSTASC